ncbi:MAG: hypothetical protein PHD82_17940, partial [Candidatus Riflebacteria bacterium]|nr:hypothetical protein [Candidatus Riflebacteria bacterium]
VATLNLSSAGLVASNPMTPDANNPPNFSLTGIAFPDGIDRACNFPINIVDGRGNISVFNTFNMNLDTEPPFVATCTVQNTAGNFVPALPGHFLKFYLQLAKFDNDTVKITCPGFAAGAPPIALPSLTPTNNPPTTFEATLLLDENPNVYGNQYQFFYEITDNAGNVTVATATLFSIDLVLPSQSNAGVIVYPPAPATTVSTLDDIASASTRLQFKTDIVSSDTLNVTVNLTALGGPASYPLQLTTSPTINLKTYIGTYTVILPPPASNATPIDGNWMNFTIYGKATSGNLVFKTTTPDIFIDNVLPNIDALTLTRPGGAVPPIIVGDIITVQATVTGVNKSLGGKVWVDLSALGGAVETPLEEQAANIWRTTINVATGSFDITKFFRATAWDDGDVKNQHVLDTDAILVDTEPPVLILATYTSIPAQGTDHPFVISGDVVKFQVELASTVTNVPYDGQTVTIDLTSAGGAAAQVMTLQPSGLYTFDFTVPNNNLLTNGATFPLVIRDNAQNLPIASTSGQIIYPSITIERFDQGQPVITAFTVTRNAGAGTIKIGDSVTFSAAVTGVREFEGGTVWSDLSAVGGPASATFINNAGNWSFTIPAVASGSLDSTSQIFRVFAYNRPEHQVSFDSAATDIDIEPPVLAPPLAWLGQIATWSVTPPLGGAHTHVNNGDLLKFEVRLASSTLNTPFDGQTVEIDLSSAGGSANQTMTLLTTELYTCTFTVPLGTLTDGATFPLIIRDNATNGPYSVLNNVAHLPIIASISLPMFDQAVPIISSFTLTRDAGPATIHIDDAVTFNATIDGVLPGGVVWSDFTSIGVPNSASYTYTNVSGNIWQAKVTIGSGSIDA